MEKRPNTLRGFEPAHSYLMSKDLTNWADWMRHFVCA